MGPFLIECPSVELLPLLVYARRSGQYGFSNPSTHLLSLLKVYLRRAFNVGQADISWYTLVEVLVQVGGILGRKRTSICMFVCGCRVLMKVGPGRSITCLIGYSSLRSSDIHTEKELKNTRVYSIPRWNKYSTFQTTNWANTRSLSERWWWYLLFLYLG